MKKYIFSFLLFVISVSSYSQLTEDFEGTTVPTAGVWTLTSGDWLTFDNGVGPTANWGPTPSILLAFNGTGRSADIARGFNGLNQTSEDWLVMPRKLMRPNEQLRFFTRQSLTGNHGTLYQIRVSTNSDPTILSAYTTYAQFDELQLNPPNTPIQYNEKVINMNQTNQELYIAFVKVYTQSADALGGDRWLIDNVQLALRCLEPTALGAEQITCDSAKIKWSNPSNASSFNVEVGLYPFDQGTSGNPIFQTISGSVNNPTNLLSGLNPGTEYAYYVQAVCDPERTSAWVGPYFFKTLRTGALCSCPINIGAIPFSNQSNTSLYGDHLTLSSAGNSCGTVGSQNYLGAQDVVYTYTPTTSSQIRITMDSFGVPNTGVFVYDSCSDIGVSCVAGIANTNSSVRVLPAVNVIAGTTYYIVLSSTSAPESFSFPYLLTIQPVTCLPPEGNPTTNITTTSATLNWANPTGQTYTSWEYFVQPFGYTIPNTAGTTVSNTPTANINTLQDGSSLLQGTNYQYWVRAGCGNGTFSPWAGPFLFTTAQCMPNEMCNYSFVLSDSGNDGWEGARMLVYQDETVVATLGTTFTSGGSQTVTIPLCNDILFNLSWTDCGINPQEVGVSIVNSFNQTLYTLPVGNANNCGTIFYRKNVECNNSNQYVGSLTTTNTNLCANTPIIYNLVLDTTSTTNVAYTWTFYDTNGSTVLGTSTSSGQANIPVSTNFTYSNPGIYITKVVVTDANNNQSTFTINSVITNCNNGGCLPPNSAIVAKDRTFCAGNAYTFEISPTPSPTSGFQYNWVFSYVGFFSTNGLFPVASFQGVTNPSFTPPYVGNYKVILTVTGPNGCNQELEYNFSVLSNCQPPSCTINSPNSNYVKQKFINLINEIRYRVQNGFPVDNNYAMTSVAFQQLKPFITDPNPGIYNFVFVPDSDSDMYFSFNDHNGENQYENIYVNSDVYIHEGFINLGDAIDFDLNNYVSPDVHFGGFFDSNPLVYETGNAKNYLIKHVNFCPDKIPCTTSNNLSPLVENLFQELIRDLIDKKANQGLSDADINSNNSAAMIALAPYCTDPDAKVWNFSSFTDTQGILKQMVFSFSKEHTEDVVIVAEFDLAELLNVDFHVDLSSFVDPDAYIDFSGDYSAIYPESKEKIIFRRFLVKHIDFCPKKNYTTSCTKENSLSAEVDLAFKNFLSFVINKKLGGWADLDFETNQINELDILAEFITDEDPGIFNFQSTYNGNTLNKISFSFDPDHIMDVTISGNLEDYVSFLPGLDLMSNYYHPNIYTLYSEPKFELKFRHINYCPTEVVDRKCLHHIVFVVDESGSLSTLAKTKIKRQLRKFIEQQKLFNDTPTPGNANIYVSLIRMSDSDTGIRTDHVIEKRVDNSTINEFETWLNNYGVYTTPSNGKSQGSDFWKSGLDRATDPSMVTKPDVVIMITDGCQTADPVALKQTMSKFSNYMPVDNAKPHLYVIGIENGFYVYDENAPGALPREQDPNYVTFDEDTTRELHRKEQGEDTAKSENEVSMPLGRLTSSLRLSLKFLLNHSGDSFPVASIDDFTMDYYGHDDFRLIGEDLTYIADNITSSTVPPRVRFLPEECGNIVPKDPCDSCFSFQPEPGKTYVVNAWVKEELNIQVTNYSNPKVRLAFFNNGAKDTPLDINLPNSSIIPPALNDDYIEFSTIGDIIDGWQRISGKFTIPTDSDFVDFKLVNKSQNFPVYFDDVRIYPVDGSMKSFVYDPVTFKLMSELDENNYATFYEYDKEGGLVRVKKETSRGVKTIQETRSGNYIKE